MFLIFGAATVAWSVAIFFFLPEEPSQARFLSKTEQARAIQRIQENMTGTKNNAIQWSQCLEALCDAQAWLLVLIQLSGQIGNGGVQGVSAYIS